MPDKPHRGGEPQRCRPQPVIQRIRRALWGLGGGAAGAPRAITAARLQWDFSTLLTTADVWRAESAAQRTYGRR